MPAMLYLTSKPNSLEVTSNLFHNFCLDFFREHILLNFFLAINMIWRTWKYVMRTMTENQNINYMQPE